MLNRDELRSLRAKNWAAVGALLAPLITSSCTCDDALTELNALIQVEPQVLDFGKVPVGASKQAKLTLRNVGSYTLTVSDFRTEAPFAPPTGTATIAVSSEIQVSVTFSPATLGASQGTLTFVTDDPDAPAINVPLVGEGIEAAVKIEPVVVDFGEVLWIANLAPQVRTVMVSNPGTDNFDLTSLELSVDGGGAFTLDPQDAVRTFAPGESRTFAVSYLPNQLGPADGTVTVRTTAPSATELSVSLVGRAVGPLLEICTSVQGGNPPAPELCTANGELPRIDFLADRNGTANGQIRLINTGDRPMTVVSGLVWSESELSFTPSPTTLGEFIVQPAAEQSFDVQYAPFDYEFDVESFTFGADASNRPTGSVAVQGVVRRAIIEVRPTTITISQDGPVAPGRVPVGILNCGQYPLVMASDVTIQQDSGPAPGLSLENAPAMGTSIQPQDCDVDPPTTEFIVVFDPPANGNYHGIVTIDSNDPLVPQVTVDVSAGRI